MMARGVALLARHYDPSHGGRYQPNDRKGQPYVLPAHLEQTEGIDGHLDRLRAESDPEHSKVLRHSHEDLVHARRQVARGDIGGANQ